MRFAAIDPGTRKVGYCILDWHNRKLRPLAMGTIRAKSAKIHKRLQEIEAELDRLFRRHRPKQVVIERVYMGKNAASALRLGESRGVTLAAAARAGADVFEYTATEAKRAVSSNGQAAKSAVQRGVQLLFGMKDPPESDSADAAALGICHASKKLGW